jgi:hypothetical protein
MQSLIPIQNHKVTATRTGLKFSGELSLEEWCELGEGFGCLVSTVAFVVGDWLVYGEDNFGAEAGPRRRVPSAQYHEAVGATGLDLTTLHNYAYVARRVRREIRTDRLSWEHHKILAKLPPGRQTEWIATCIAEEEAGSRVSTRRLRKSLTIGRLATAADMEPANHDPAPYDHVKLVKNLCGWWKRLQASDFLVHATREQRLAMKRDFAPVVRIFNLISEPPSGIADAASPRHGGDFGSDRQTTSRS